MRDENYVSFIGRSLGIFLLLVALVISSATGSESQATSSDVHPSGHRRLSNPIDGLLTDSGEPHIEYLVIGSGYGASVAALRIAEALHQLYPQGLRRPRLAILERGKEWFPGDFPTSFLGLTQQLRSHLNPLGLVSIDTNASHAHMDVVGASGLGGTSLLNAAITLRPPANVWEQPEWPTEIRTEARSGALERYFQIAAEMLRATLGPHTSQVLKSTIHRSNFPPGVPTGELTLNVNHDQGFTSHGVIQNACTHCGNCCGGCNVGAKNTLTTTYLPCAKDLGAEIFTQIEVDYIEKLAVTNEGGYRYRVHFTYHHQDRLGITHSKKGSVTTNHIFLGAGSAGSTRILMRSRDFLPLSSQLGQHVSANGDVLGFVYNSERKTNIVSYPDTESLALDRPDPVGQTITVFADYRAANKDGPLATQFVLLDGAIPRAFGPEIARILSTTAGMVFSFSLSSPKTAVRIARDMFCQYPGPEGALNHSMLLLACGHDSSGGRYELSDRGDIYVVWPGVQSEASFQYIKAQMEAYAKRLGGKFIPNPRSAFWGGGMLQAPHPLGGAVMGETVSTGVVNHLGQVFNTVSEHSVYPGFYVLDASTIPRSLAAPPLITITGLAERAMEDFVHSLNTCAGRLSP